ncbi:MAG: hypothetical protein A2243_09695 [Omnitrophica WOR_2 bacterium RIFOXYA2_FULL_38_17]|nr:MAG: hypothetical protein A2243_09695 [Omnitrophica WOR_2 bacterium RIFOXYA2_FULL_38_17]OGX59106.1 MAG: hypothetical protein A2447_00150 [Omnitrophica WOR_2 bacterium RIFOXYC2_FULL_38_12]
MKARYLIRIDDACHTMDRTKWQLMEDILDEFNIKPIVSVIPESRDPGFMLDEPDEGFWNKVRAWQSKGWTIALHGYTHQLHETESPMILPYYKRTEFAGLPYEKQAAKIRASWNIFNEHRVTPKIWVAPAHTFDKITLHAIRNETDIKFISDGIALDVYYEYDFYWIPQQLWNLTERFSGLWTVCLHPNSMSNEEMQTFRQLVRNKFSERIISFSDVTFNKTPKTILSRLFHMHVWLQRKKIRYALSIFNNCKK